MCGGLDLGTSISARAVLKLASGRGAVACTAIRYGTDPRGSRLVTRGRRPAAPPPAPAAAGVTSTKTLPEISHDVADKLPGSPLFL
jgi:hypothetical protein